MHAVRRERAGEGGAGALAAAAEGRRPGRTIRLALWALLLLLPALLAAALLAGQRAEETLLSRAAARLERGELEAARAALEPLLRRKGLSGAARRRAAELLLRLGEDRTAHTLLLGLPYDPADPGDRHLRELSARCQRAAQLVRRADAVRDPFERVRLLRAAREELPDGLRLLERLAEAELQAMLARPTPPGRGPSASGASRAFEEVYTELRLRAPSRAEALKARLRALADGAYPPEGHSTAR